MKILLFLLFWCISVQTAFAQSIEQINNSWKAASLSYFHRIKYDHNNEWEKKLMESRGKFIEGLASKNYMRENFLINLQNYDSLFYNKVLYIIEEFDPSGEYPLYFYHVLYPGLPMLSFIYRKENNSWSVEKGQVYSRKELSNRFNAYKTFLRCKDKNWASVNFQSFSYISNGKIVSKVSPAVCESTRAKLFK